MGKVDRHWMQIHSIYGTGQWNSLLLTLLHGFLLSILSFLLLSYFGQICHFLARSVPSLSLQACRFAAGVAGSLMGLAAVGLFFKAANDWHSKVVLHWQMSQKMVGMVGDWCNVKTALDIGCGRGILLNAVARQLKKEGSSGRVVGIDLWLAGQEAMSATLKTATIEGVQEYVTCRSGDARNLPFMDNYFDVVVSAGFLHTVGREFGHKSPAAAAERAKALQEVVRVLKAGGMAVIWDLMYVHEYVQRLNELKMQEIKVCDSGRTFMAQSQIVSFRKPLYQVHLNRVV